MSALGYCGKLFGAQPRFDNMPSSRGNRAQRVALDAAMEENRVPWATFTKYWQVLVQRGWKQKKSHLREFDYFNLDRTIQLQSRQQVIEYVKKLTEKESEAERKKAEEIAATDAEKRKEAKRAAGDTHTHIDVCARARACVCARHVIAIQQ